jgi:transcription-repair coupling factor (superfamily II helicase)
VHTRLIMYKRIASAADADELSELRVEMVDRFGSLPPPLQNLFQVTRLRLRAATLGISRIDFGPKGGTLEFRQDTRVDPIALVRLVQSEPNSYRLEGGAKLRMTRALETPEQRFEAVQALLGRLQGDSGKEQVADGSQRKGRAAVSG